MPYYSFSASIPAGRTEDDPVVTELQLRGGVIHQLEVLSAPGSARKLQCRIFEGLHQLFPTNQNEPFYLDGTPIVVREFHELKRMPYRLRMKAWNESANYAHTVTARFGVLPKSILLPWTAASPRLSGILRRL